MSRSLFEELQASLAPASLDARGENAWHVAVKFLTLLQEHIPEEEERKKLMSTWMRAVKDNDYKKFQRALRRYHRRQDD